MTEYHDRVASHNAGVTIDQDAYVIANQSADGDTERKA